MNKKILLSLILLSLFGTAVWAQGRKYPTTPPKAEGFPPLQLKPYQSFTLPNGLRVFVIEDKTLPKVTVYTAFDYPPVKQGDKAGFLDMFGELIMAGTEKKDKATIDEQIDFYGANISFGSDYFSVFTLKKHLPTILDLTAEILLKPTFPEEELEKIRERTLSNLKAVQDSPEAIADNLRRRLSFGDKHPYGEVATPQTVKNITREDFVKFYQTYYRPNVAYMAFVGYITLDEAKSLVEKYFGAWEKGNVPTEYLPVPQPPKATQVAIAEKAGAVQSVLRLTYPIKYNLADKNYLVARLANQILGGNANARLFRNLREDKGYTYGAYSRLIPDRWAGYFIASADVRNAVTDSAMVEMIKEMERMRNEVVPEDELRRAKNILIGSFARSLERPETIAQFAINTAIYNLPAEYYTTYIPRLEAIKAQEVQFVARQYFLPSNAYIIGVGDIDVLQSKLARFGPVKRYDAFGNEYKGVDLASLEGVSVASVINQYLRAIAGTRNISDIRSLQQNVSFTIQGLQIETVTVRTAQGFETKVKTPFGLQLIRFDGKKVLNKTPQGERVIDNPEDEVYKRAKAGTYVLLERDYQKLGYKATLTDAKTMDGKVVLEITYESPEGVKEKRYYDKESGLLLQTIDADGTTAKYLEYAEVEGFQLPVKAELSLMGQTTEATISYQINPDVTIESIP
ncbi:M16 family metallopeptidase [Thermonema rossianum]|uniref:M16 family metallopeptidase n=1 Tax=Thermonema rossianum TaxID=55505 RepID=UPI000691EAC1|nr:pitrilysin family protein [Thermonema rossianum]